MPKKSSDKAGTQKNNGKKDNSSAVFDVSKPGSTPASPTSRPVIVGHQSAIKQDPLLSGDINADKAASTKGPEPAFQRTAMKKIKPLETKDPEPTKEIVETEEPENAESSEDSDKTAIDTLAGEIDQKAQENEQLKAETEHAEKIQALIDNKKYQLPITEGGKKAASERAITWLLIFLLVAAVGAWFAIDAGYLDIGIDLPYDLIKN